MFFKLTLPGTFGGVGGITGGFGTFGNVIFQSKYFKISKQQYMYHKLSVIFYYNIYLTKCY